MPAQAPAYISSGVDIPGFSTFGVRLRALVVAGFTTDAALNGTWRATADPDSDIVYSFQQPGSGEDNFLGYNSDRWTLHGDFGVTTAEDKADWVTGEMVDPRSATYVGEGDSAGDTVTITAAPPTVITE